ncbi:heat-inducible transcriptional repressor HrcA [Paludicola sp. MB14-C6]|uniref:heat-inducible transcriptional repressor HrcA n=1 Tax=Paludihabitans sp. MB14-C6 TaxID=3070656 RepID=UPI0027DC0F3A|nr:heat-inducible transcriptional repressor HrcA [Paludicola sp. MB14-C6]WMJ22479.1 heat-inducible transcriptional repressor HrcA [Paludicola sp. MB14-C6]
MTIDKRKMCILSAIVDEYIKTGEPVGSNAVLHCLNMNVSSATVRNDMAFLEKQGFLEQPHTSAGRIPTYLGYRFYIDNLMAPKPLSTKEKKLIDSLLNEEKLQTADAIVDTAVNVLSDLTQLAVVSKSNMPVFSVITRVEVIPAGRRLYALLIITSAGSIKNKICRMEFDLTNQQLEYFAKFINENLTGINLDKLNPAMLQNLAIALGAYMMSLSPLLHAVYELGEEMSKADVNVHGEQNLLSTCGLNSQEVVTLLTHKNQLDYLLSSAFDGVSVVFGKENESFAVTNSSMIVSPYKMHGEQVGSFGVIGPVRVDYAKVIPHIEYVTKSVTKLLTDVIDYNKQNREDD